MDLSTGLIAGVGTKSKMQRITSSAARMMHEGSSTDIKRTVNVIRNLACRVIDITSPMHILTDINQYSLSVGFDIQRLLEFPRLLYLPEIC